MTRPRPIASTYRVTWGVAPARASVMLICCSRSSIWAAASLMIFSLLRQRPLDAPVPRTGTTSSGRNGRGVEKERLGDRRLYGRALERLGDQERRLGPLAGQQPLREGGDEDHRHREFGQYVLHGIDARTVVGELDIGQHQAGTPRHGLRHRLVAGDGHSGHTVAEVAHDGLDIHRDDRLVLDDQDLGASLPFDLVERLADQCLHLIRRGADQIAGILGGEALHRGEQQRLAGQGRDPGKPRLRDSFLGGAGGVARILLDIGRGPDGVKGLVESQARIDVAREVIGRRDDRFERGTHEIVAMLLAAGERACIATQEGKMRREFLTERHALRLLSDTWPDSAYWVGGCGFATRHTSWTDTDASLVDDGPGPHGFKGVEPTAEFFVSTTARADYAPAESGVCSIRFDSACGWTDRHSLCCCGRGER